MKEKTKMEDLILCDNEGKTWKNNCDFIFRQCSALSEGKLLMITGEGYCSTPIDPVGGLDGVSKIDSIGNLETIGSAAPGAEVEAQLKATMPSITVDDINLKVTVGSLESIGKLDDISNLDDVEDVDAVPTVPNKRPPIATPKIPRTPRPFDAFPKTINPRINTEDKGQKTSAAPKVSVAPKTEVAL